MDYDKLTQTEALDILKNDFGETEVEYWQGRNHIISAPDVLYYADAYGDLEDAILLQGWDKSLPEQVHKGLVDSELDIFEAVDVNDLEAERCPCCDTELWHFEISQPGEYTRYELVDEYGNVDGEFLEHVSEPDGRYWNADPEDDHSFTLCAVCSRDVHRDFPRTLSDKGSVVVHYGETDEISAFAVAGNLVKWEFEDRLGFRGNDNWTDLWGLPGDDQTDAPEAFAKVEQTAFFNSYGWDEIAWSDVQDALNPYASVHKRTSRSEYRNIAESWAEGDETHPDLRFTYIMDFAGYGTPSFWCASEDREALMAEIVDLIERQN